MGISDELSALQSTAREQLPLLNSKKKGENTLLLPFFAMLGYHPFDVRDVEPEFSIGVDGGEESVDYALKKGGSPAILFRVKEVGANLDAYDPGPLLRFLNESEARVGALTDGVKYRFYADLESFYEVLKGEAPTERGPFLTFHLLDHTEAEVDKLERLTKPVFKAEEILSFAHRLKYTRLFREYLQRQLEAPEAPFVQFMMKRVHGGTAPKGDAGMYESPLQEALQQLMGDAERTDGPSFRAEAHAETTEEESAQDEPGQDEPGASEKAISDESRSHREAEIKEENESGEEGESEDETEGTGFGESSLIDKNFEEGFRERLGR